MVQKNSRQIKENNHQDEHNDKTDNRKGFLERDVSLKKIGHLGMVVIANQETKNDTGKGGYFPEETPENTLYNKEGYQPKDDKIKNIHGYFLPKAIFISQVHLNLT